MLACGGFLASEKIRRNGDLNVGMLDQRQVLKWVQEHISQVRSHTLLIPWLFFQDPATTPLKLTHSHS